ncbi:DUF805 domain-containing protein [Jidongwangia harbinensis]|uniref:DUF805 domain-containing protein n=1 Tax=Jidongwangia harbinensis TaxID=2878561 RepID=UPI001CDA166D|nr:DUF805 domain-containing protein [Jidongwangia harbinensis]MCA2217948.1 DUF805 domain-containing protein [Jidongwangia harbinensis]
MTSGVLGPYLSAFRRYVDFRGRAGRSEYWMFVLIHLLVLAGLLGLAVWQEALSALFSLYYLGTIVPGVALAARRLHDTGQSGWLQLIVFIPFGGIALLVLLLLPGERGPNRHGPDPRDAVERPSGPDPWSTEPDWAKP